MLKLLRKGLFGPVVKMVISRLKGPWFAPTGGRKIFSTLRESTKNRLTILVNGGSYQDQITH